MEIVVSCKSLSIVLLIWKKSLHSQRKKISAWIDEPTLDQDMFEKKYLHYIDTRFNVMMDKVKDNFKNHQL